MTRSELVMCPNCSKSGLYNEYMIRAYAKSSERVEISYFAEAKYKTKWITIGYFCLKCGLFKSTYIVSNVDPHNIPFERESLQIHLEII